MSAHGRVPTNAVQRNLYAQGLYARSEMAGIAANPDIIRKNYYPS